MYVDTKEPIYLIPATPSLAYLANHLRHPENWPKGFEWNFNHCSTCALQLAHELWPEQIPGIDMSWSVLAFDLSVDAAAGIFCRKFLGHFSRDYVRPITVARRIERYLRWGIS